MGMNVLARLTLNSATRASPLLAASPIAARAFSERATGHVKWFDAKKGFGFIAAEDGGDVFVHHTAVQKEGFRSLGEGEPVEFEIKEDGGRKSAVNVTGPGGAEPVGTPHPRSFGS